MTGTNQANELYELCKEVYERTGWNNGSRIGTMEYLRTPLYTSDYLLEKLPVYFKEGTLSSLYELDEDNRPWCWGYHYDDKRVQLKNGYYAQGWADTPLKALLRLTIALSEAGELNG